ncbi:hypothetical protein B0H34DRAFT_383792 [Crassisporium funariophilum]|nr:hypothetical protein B0H34DRAFT_383792 [Crassisporium funariophilum]
MFIAAPFASLLVAVAAVSASSVPLETRAIPYTKVDVRFATLSVKNHCNKSFSIFGPKGCTPEYGGTRNNTAKTYQFRFDIFDLPVDCNVELDDGSSRVVATIGKNAGHAAGGADMINRGPGPGDSFTRVDSSSDILVTFCDDNIIDI